jgi:long-chain acyl-CoA synthetase
MIAANLTGRHVVLTGVTGFLGKVWLVLLLDRFPQIGRVTLLVRGGKAGAHARFEHLADTSPAFRPLRERHGPHLGTFLGERLEILDADLTRDHCGLDAATRAELRDADLFLHCAGITDFDPDPKKALATNVDGAIRVAELAEAAGAPMIHVSTCYVTGIRDGDVPEALEQGVSPNGTRFDPVQALADARQAIHKPRRADRVDAGMALARSMGWPNIYTWSKGLAEHALAARPALKLCIARPAIVECAASYPFPGWNEGLNTAGPLAWLISTAFRRLPANPDHRFDIVPVDHVARGLLLLSAAAIDGRAPAVAQLASSDVHPLTFRRTIELTGLALRRYTRKGKGTDRERTWFRHLDPVPGKGGWLAPFAVRDWIPTVREGLADLKDRSWSGRAGEIVDDLDHRLSRLSADVDKVDDMLTLYKPFIHDHDWCFATANARRFNAELPDDEADLAFDVTELCWRSYWVDVEYPGLQTFCIPILRGETVPADRPSTPPLRIVRPARVASK